MPVQNVACPHCGKEAFATVPPDTDIKGVQKHREGTKESFVCSCGDCGKSFVVNTADGGEVHTVLCPHCERENEIPDIPNKKIQDITRDVSRSDNKYIKECIVCEEEFALETIPGTDVEVSLDALQTLREEARTTLDKQFSSQGNLNRQNNRFLRLNFILSGLILTALSLSNGETAYLNAPTLDWFTITGLCFLVLSTGVSLISVYDSMALFGGIDSRTIQPTLRHGLDDKRLHLDLIDAYGDWIGKNQELIVRRTAFMLTTALLLLYSLTFIALGILNSLVGPIPTPVVLGIIFLLFLITYESELHELLHMIWTGESRRLSSGQLPNLADTSYRE